MLTLYEAQDGTNYVRFAPHDKALLATTLNEHRFIWNSLPQNQMVRVVETTHSANEEDSAQQPFAIGPTPGDSNEKTTRLTIIDGGGEWRWLHPLDGLDPEAQLDGFHRQFPQLDFDDSKWQQSMGSSAGFHYGINSEGLGGVHLGEPEEDKRYSAYFRHRFTTTEAFQSLQLHCQRDDGIIAYLDGIEVIRDNVNQGPDSFRLLARDPVLEDFAVHRYQIPGTLEAGEHVLAISLHNGAADSSDLRLARVSLTGERLRVKD